MKKEELKNGMIVELRNGDYFFKISKNLIRIDENRKEKIISLNRYNSNLEAKHHHKELDIMIIFKDFSFKKILWKRIEPIKLTNQEKNFLESLNPKYKWITKNKLGSVYSNKEYVIYLYEIRPKKWEEKWSRNLDTQAIYSDLLNGNMFQFIKWEDEEPYNIEALLKEGE